MSVPEFEAQDLARIIKALFLNEKIRQLSKRSTDEQASVNNVIIFYNF